MSTNKPTLSIVTATLGKFTDDWLCQLLNIKGSVEFILVYPPGIKYRDINEPRIKFITSPYKGEVMQRFTGLLNAQAEYVLALDDDDFIHPDVLQLVNQYFQIFPESWVLRLKSINIDTTNEAKIQEPWGEIPDLSLLDLETKNPDASYSFKNNPSQKLLEIPITPIDKKFDIRYAIWPFMKRTDHQGRHMENFNTKVWKNELVQKAIPTFSQTTKLWEMKMAGALAWIPSWNLDRSLCLFIQAQLYEKDIMIGHWMATPEQVRFLEKPLATKEPRILLAADALLVKKFPQYGYFWNLFFYQVYTLPRTFGKAIKMSLFK
ncbi:glycosyltransferase family A protein [Anabaena azotica]|uniref:glycosyltransferase family A protein n=1 Tax=Anabaena azotica TaxID=197653 RepID=UPI0039A50CBB